MKKLLIVLLFGFYAELLLAQNFLINVKSVGSIYWKYINLKGEIIIDCQYPKTYPFSSDGFAVTYFPKKNLYIIINARGQEIKTQPKNFQLKDIYGYGAKGYSDGLIAVKIMKKWGYMDTLGNIAVPVKYDFITEFNCGHGIGKTDDRFFVIDRRGNQVPVEDPSIKEIKKYSDSLAPFVSENGLYGFINTSGKIAIPAQFVSVDYFEHGYAWAKSSNEFFGLINKKGEWVIKPVYDELKQFDTESGLAKARRLDTRGYVNLQGEFLTFPASDICDDFSEGLARGRKGEKFGYINNQGQWAIEPRFEGLRDFKNGFAAAKYGGLWGIIDKQGKWIVQPSFIGISDVTVIH